MIARNRLVDVNHWRDYASGISADFQLTDRHGAEVNRTAEAGDYFKIRIRPTPSDGFDWVHVEAVEDKSDSNAQTEQMAIRVRPAPDPTTKGENISHFFSDSATSSFVVERNGKRVLAAVYGRNEIPNTDADGLAAKVRNAVVGVGALLGFAEIQWKNLVKGLLAPSQPGDG